MLDPRHDKGELFWKFSWPTVVICLMTSGVSLDYQFPLGITDMALWIYLVSAWIINFPLDITGLATYVQQLGVGRIINFLTYRHNKMVLCSTVCSLRSRDVWIGGGKFFRATKVSLKSLFLYCRRNRERHSEYDLAGCRRMLGGGRMCNCRHNRSLALKMTRLTAYITVRRLKIN